MEKRLDTPTRSTAVPPPPTDHGPRRPATWYRATGWIVAWAAVALALNLGCPAWTHAADAGAETRSTADASKLVDEAFPGTGTDNIAFVVVAGDGPMRGSTLAYLDALARRLSDDSAAVRTVLDPSGDPLTAPATRSSDRRTAFLTTWLRGDLGSTQGIEALDAARVIVHAVPAPEGVRTYVTGPAATAAACQHATVRHAGAATVAVLALVSLLVVAVTRSFAVTAGVLVSGLLGAAVALPVLATLPDRLHGSPPLAWSLTVALALGTAWTTISTVRTRHPVRLPLAAAPPLLVAAVLTCAAFFPGARQLGLAPAAAVLVASVIATGAARPVSVRRPRARPAWATRLRWVRWLGRRPVTVIAVAGALAAVLTFAAPSLSPSYDPPGSLPSDTEAGVGYAVAARDLPAGRLFPIVVVVRARHDLRNPAGLIAIDRVTQRLLQRADVGSVQSASWPGGMPWPDATLAHQFGAMNQRLQSQALSTVPLTQAVNRLPATMSQLGAALGQLQRSLDGGAAGMGAVRASLETMQSSIVDANDTARYFSGYADPVRRWRDGFADCSADFLCSRVDGLLTPVDDLLRDMDGLVAGTATLHTGMSAATGSFGGAAAATNGATSTLAQMKPLVDGMVSTINSVMPQLTQMTTFANIVSDDLGQNGAGGFYLPQDAIDSPAYRAARTQLFSPDGRSTRLFVYPGGAPRSDHATSTALSSAVAEATKFGPLADAAVVVAGPPADAEARASGSPADPGPALALAGILVAGVTAVALRRFWAGVTVAGAAVVSFLAGLGGSEALASHATGATTNWTAPPSALCVVVAVVAGAAFGPAARIVRRDCTVATSPLIVVGLAWAGVLAVASSAFVTSSEGQVGVIAGFGFVVAAAALTSLPAAAAALTRRNGR